MKNIESIARTAVLPVEVPYKVARVTIRQGVRLGQKVLGRGLAAVEYLGNSGVPLTARIEARRPEAEIAQGLELVEIGRDKGDEDLIELGTRHAGKGLQMASDKVRAARASLDEAVDRVQQADLNAGLLGVDRFTAERLDAGSDPEPQP